MTYKNKADKAEWERNKRRSLAPTPEEKEAKKAANYQARLARRRARYHQTKFEQLANMDSLQEAAKKEMDFEAQQAEQDRKTLGSTIENLGVTLSSTMGNTLENMAAMRSKSSNKRLSILAKASVLQQKKADETLLSSDSKEETSQDEKKPAAVVLESPKHQNNQRSPATLPRTMRRTSKADVLMTPQPSSKPTSLLSSMLNMVNPFSTQKKEEALNDQVEETGEEYLERIYEEHGLGRRKADELDNEDLLLKDSYTS